MARAKLKKRAKIKAKAKLSQATEGPVQPAAAPPSDRTPSQKARRSQRQRSANLPVQPDVPAAKVTPEPLVAPPPMTQAEALAELARRASEGNEYCLAGLRKMLDEDPKIWRKLGNVSGLAEKSWIALLSNGNKLMEESIPRRLEEMKNELGDPHATPLEKLLIELVGVTWLAAQHGEIDAAGPGGGNLQQANFRLRRAESSQRRLLAAVKTLQLIRALVPRGLRSSGPGTNPPEAVEPGRTVCGTSQNPMPG